jgi:polar amino acid transport system permease protein
MDFSLIWQEITYLIWGAYPNGNLGGALLTLVICASAGIASTLLGILLGICLVMFNGWATRLLIFVLGFFRAIPVIMLIFWVYFLLPIAFNVDAPAVSSVIFALTLIYAAYLAHAVKAGIIALGPGQWQAGLSLGLNRWQVLRLIILPQSLRIMIPSFINQWVALIKDSSLAYVINVTELTYIATQINGDSYGVYSAEVFIFIGAAYFIFCMVIDLFINTLNYLLRPRLKAIA